MRVGDSIVSDAERRSVRNEDVDVLGRGFESVPVSVPEGPAREVGHPRRAVDPHLLVANFDRAGRVDKVVHVLVAIEHSDRVLVVFVLADVEAAIVVAGHDDLVLMRYVVNEPPHEVDDGRDLPIHRDVTRMDEDVAVRQLERPMEAVRVADCNDPSDRCRHLGGAARSCRRR